MYCKILGRGRWNYLPQWLTYKFCPISTTKIVSIRTLSANIRAPASITNSFDSSSLTTAAVKPAALDAFPEVYTALGLNSSTCLQKMFAKFDYITPISHTTPYKQTYIPHYTIQTHLYPPLHHTNTPICHTTPYKHTYMTHYTIQTNLYPTLHHRNTPIPPPHNTNLYPTIHYIHKPTSHTTPYKQTCTPH